MRPLLLFCLPRADNETFSWFACATGTEGFETLGLYVELSLVCNDRGCPDLVPRWTALTWCKRSHRLQGHDGRPDHSLVILRACDADNGADQGPCPLKKPDGCNIGTRSFQCTPRTNNERLGAHNTLQKKKIAVSWFIQHLTHFHTFLFQLWFQLPTGMEGESSHSQPS